MTALETLVPNVTTSSDVEFLRAVAAMDAPVGHRDNLRLAWLLLTGHSPANAAVEMLSAITRRATARGGVVHVTKTMAWTIVVADALRHDALRNAALRNMDDPTFELLVADHPRLLDSGLLRRHYSEEVLESASARTGWVEPDLAPLPIASITLDRALLTPTGECEVAR
ncbi:MAG: hypothetical protein AB7N61_24095 [Acidimicrobiia bacterium]